MLKIAIAISSLLIINGCATGPKNSSGGMGLSGENLVFSIPKAFDPSPKFSKAEGNQETTEIVLIGETLENWSQLLTVQLLPPTNKSFQFYQSIEENLKKMCPEGFLQKIDTPEKQNGYSISSFWIFCPLNPKTQMGESTIVKTIEGKDKFYVVQWAYKKPQYKAKNSGLTKEEIIRAASHLKNVIVCDNRDLQRKCP